MSGIMPDKMAGKGEDIASCAPPPARALANVPAEVAGNAKLLERIVIVGPPKTTRLPFACGIMAWKQGFSARRCGGESPSSPLSAPDGDLRPPLRSGCACAALRGPCCPIPQPRAQVGRDRADMHSSGLASTLLDRAHSRGSARAAGHLVRADVTAALFARRCVVDR
jgi:hypothetical protein